MLTSRFILLVLIICVLPLACGSRGQNDGAENRGLSGELRAQPAMEQRLSTTNDAISNSRSNAITRAVARVSSAVVGINVTQIRRPRRGSYFDDPFFQYLYPELARQVVKSLGSGFLIDPNGYILTNEHVVHEASEIVVSLSDGSSKNAKVIGIDYVTDLALIQIEGHNLPYLTFGNSNNVIIGEWVIALGNPYGLFEINAQPTVTVGVVSAVDRDFGRQDNDRVYQDMIQTDAAINQGNSGGPLVNSLGQVIGMNTFIYTGGQSNSGSIGIGFAIPSNRVQRILRDLKKYGKVNRSWTTGLSVEDIPPMVARYYRMKSADGVIVSNVEPRSPAAAAGIEVGDVIVALNGERIRREKDIWRIIDDSDLHGGDKLRVKMLRGGRALSVSLELREINSKR